MLAQLIRNKFKNSLFLRVFSDLYSYILRRKKGLFCDLYMCDYVIKVAQALRCRFEKVDMFMALESEKEQK